MIARPTLRSLAVAALTLAIAIAPIACSSSDPATTASGGASSASSSSAGGSGGSGGADAEPEKPAGLVSYVTGDAADAPVTPTGPGLILMGGGTDVDAAFEWWKPYVAGGDVLILRASGSDGYNDYLYSDIGGIDSVETLLVTTKALAQSAYVAWKIEHAEGIFIAGGDQAVYMEAWKGTAVATALQAAWSRGAVIGGTSAGCDVLGELIFAAYEGTVYSDEALEDPYNPFMTMERDFLALPPLAKTITDTHFAERDRMGRLVGFLARVIKDGWAADAQGIGIDEATALVVDPAGQATVLGSGSVYVVRPGPPPISCEAGKNLDFKAISYFELSAGDTLTLPSGAPPVPAKDLSAAGGVLSPADPY